MKGQLHVLDRSGHTTTLWDTDAKPGTPLDPAYAEKEFARLVTGGHLAVGTTKDKTHEQIKQFDPHEFPLVTITPQIAGG